MGKKPNDEDLLEKAIRDDIEAEDPEDGWGPVAVIPDYKKTFSRTKRWEKAPLLQTNVKDGEDLCQAISDGAVKVVLDAIQRGKFEFRDIEAITSALIVLALKDGQNPDTRAKISSITAQLNRLTGVVRSRMFIEIQEDTAKKVSRIEMKLRQLKSDRKGNK